MEHLHETSVNDPYAKAVGKVVKGMENASGKLTHLDVLGKEIAKATTENKPKKRYVKGYMAKPTITLHWWFSVRTFDRRLDNQLK